MIALRDFIARIETRKAALGVSDAPAVVEAMRNKGARRTPQKRELLRRTAERAKAVGREPIVSYY